MLKLILPLIAVTITGTHTSKICYDNLGYKNGGDNLQLIIYVVPETKKLQLEVKIAALNKPESVRLISTHSKAQILETFKYGGYVPFAINAKMAKLKIVNVKVNGIQLCQPVTDVDTSLDTKSFKFEKKLIKAMSINQLKRRSRRDTRNNICGKPQKDTTGLIVGGKETDIEKWPWLTALMERKNKKYSFFCGGTVIKNNLVLTAAHCMYKRIGTLRKENEFMAVFGSVDPKNIDDDTGLMSKILNIYIHDEYVKENLRNDIAIVRVDPLQYNEAIIPICLGGNSDQRRIHGFKATVVGWGATETDDYSDVLKETDVKIVNITTCRANEHQLFKYTWKNNFCAVGVDGTPCGGDSGSGLYIFGKNRWNLRGVVSLRITAGKCQIENKHIVFTDVVKYLGWIRNIAEKS